MAGKLLRHPWFKIAVLVALPLTLYLFLAEKRSWKPHTLHIGSSVTAVSFSPDSQHLAVAIYRGRYTGVQVWDIKSASLQQEFRAIHVYEGFSHIALSSTGAIAAGNPDSQATLASVRLWDANGTQHSLEKHSHSRSLRSNWPFVFSPDGQQVMSAGIAVSTLVDGTIDGHQDDRLGITTWDAQTGKAIRSVPILPPRGRVLNQVDTDELGWGGTAWSLSPGRSIGAITTFKQNPHWPQFGDTYGGLLIFDPRSGKMKHLLNTAMPTIDRLVFAPNERTFTLTVPDSSHNSGTVQLWDAVQGKLQQTLKGQTKGYPLAFSPDSTLVATGGYNRLDNRVLLWDTKTGHLVRKLTGHHKIVSTVSFSPDGTTLATGGNDGTVKLWRVK